MSSAEWLPIPSVPHDLLRYTDVTASAIAFQNLSRASSGLLNLHAVRAARREGGLTMFFLLSPS